MIKEDFQLGDSFNLLKTFYFCVKLINIRSKETSEMKCCSKILQQTLHRSKFCDIKNSL